MLLLTSLFVVLFWTNTIPVIHACAIATGQISAGTKYGVKFSSPRGGGFLNVHLTAMLLDFGKSSE